MKIKGKMGRMVQKESQNERIIFRERGKLLGKSMERRWEKKERKGSVKKKVRK